MRGSGICAWLFILVTAAFATELEIKVVDPQSAVVSGARVELLDQAAHSSLEIKSTSPEGVARFTISGSHRYRLRVLAAGFAEFVTDVGDSKVEYTVQLRPAPASELVVVTAARTPVPAEEANASISTLNAGQIETLNPIASDDAIRFLPGVVLGTQGQRGGLTS